MNVNKEKLYYKIKSEQVSFMNIYMCILYRFEYYILILKYKFKANFPFSISSGVQEILQCIFFFLELLFG